MKSDQDYIRKAVELADHWALIRVWDGEDWIDSLDYKWSLSEPHIRCLLQDAAQTTLDALACQLTRQVDALNEFWIDSDMHGVAKIWRGFLYDRKERIAKANDKNRTMNTLKAIIDSEVLS